jgi:hypothetical protein
MPLFIQFDDRNGRFITRSRNLFGKGFQPTTGRRMGNALQAGNLSKTHPTAIEFHDILVFGFASLGR